VRVLADDLVVAAALIACAVVALVATLRGDL
jgi:hypothetical protein